MKSVNPAVGQRLASMILDHFFMCMICIMPITIAIFATGSLDGNEPGLAFSLAFVFAFAVYMAKDSFNGKSPAKRILKMQVVREGTIDPASPARCFVRNLLLPFWPVEVIATLFSPGRRLGDRIAGTRVLTDSYIKHLRQTKLVQSIGEPAENAS